MTKYIALLRGINVGGKNKVNMSELKSAFVGFGFSHVSTYINSGNVLFSSVEKDVLKLKGDCEGIIREHFELEILVAVVSVEELKKALEHAPEWWDQDPDSKHNAIFVMAPTTVEAVFVAVGEIKPEYERVGFYGNVIFWSAPVNTFSKTRWSKVVGSKIYGQITIRNANTVKKLSGGIE